MILFSYSDYPIANATDLVYNGKVRDCMQKWRAIMRISYKKLWVLLAERETSKSALRKELGLSAGTYTKLNKGEEVSLSILLKIYDYLDCDIGDICEAVRK